MERTTVLGRLTWQIGDVVATQSENGRTKSLAIALPGWPGHLPGQHVDIRLTAEDGYQAQRSYSIASPPEERERVTLTVERLDDGEVSPYLTDELRVGDKIELRGPIGGYFVWKARMGGPLLLLAGGSGIVPLMSMIRHRQATGSEVPVRLLYSVRSNDDVIYHDELARFGQEDKGVEVIYTFTRKQPEGWTGYSRRVDTELLRDIIWPPAQRPLTYICGPTQFVETAATALLPLGYQPTLVKTERFGPTGEGQ
jgi:ferredoxin-NADP reductase